MNAMVCTQKKRGTFSPSLVILRSWTTLIYPITTSKAHAIRRERRCFTPGRLTESVQVSE